MERSHDPVQIELRNRVERREKMKKFKFYVACLILCPIATTCFVYAYLKLHSIQMSFVWVLIFLDNVDSTIRTCYCDLRNQRTEI